MDCQRKAYVRPVGNVRITFDIGLRTVLGPVSLFDFDASTTEIINEPSVGPSVILEIKFDDVLPQHIRGLFPSTIQPRSAIGKFVLCRVQQACREVEFYMPPRSSGTAPRMVEPLSVATTRRQQIGKHD